jgi:t-SNARE complex subunit (syntaxin)
MEAMRSTWTDSRLDDLKETVGGIDKKVVRLETKVDAGFAGLGSRIDGTNGRIDKLNHTLVQTMVALISVIAVLLSVLIGIVATHI